MMEQIHASKNGAGTTGLPSAKKKKKSSSDFTLKINSKWNMDLKQSAGLLEDNRKPR